MKEETINKLLGTMFLLLAFAGQYTSLTLFHQGFHNVDLTHNFMKVSLEINQVLVPYNVSLMSIDKVQDNSTLGIITLQQGYWGGIKQMRDAIYVSFFTTIFFVLGIVLMLTPDLSNLQLSVGSKPADKDKEKSGQA